MRLNMMILNIYIFTFVLNLIKFCSCPGGEDLEKTRKIIEDLQRRANESYARGDYKKTISHCTKLIEQDRTNDSFFKLRGNCYVQRGYDEKALVDFLEAKRLNPDNPDHRTLFCQTGDTKYGERFEIFGKELLDEEKYQDAIACFTEAIKKNPYESKLYIARAICHAKIEDVQAAKDTLKIGLTRLGFHSQNWKELLEELFNLEGYKEAIEAAVSSKNEISLVNLGNELLAREKFDEALLVYTEAIIQKPVARHFKLRGMCYLRKGDLESARKDFEKAVEKDNLLPTSKKVAGYGQALLSLTMLQLEKTEEAHKEIQLLDRDSILMMGDELLWKGDYEKSLIYYNEASNRFPKDGECYRRRGIYYRKKGDYDNAMQDFETAIGLEPLSLNFRIDYINLLLEAKKLEKAEAALEEMNTKFKDSLDTLYKAEKKEIKLLYSKLEQMEEIIRSEKLKAAIGLRGK